MIAVDTNILVRLLVQDDAAQAARAERLISEAQESGETCLISEVVLCELEWVLVSCYKANRADFMATIESFLLDSNFVIRERLAVETALAAYKRGKADFSDYLIGALALGQGARTVYTFDRGLRNEKGFFVVGGALGD